MHHPRFRDALYLDDLVGDNSHLAELEAQRNRLTRPTQTLGRRLPPNPMTRSIERSQRLSRRSLLSAQRRLDWCDPGKRSSLPVTCLGSRCVEVQRRHPYPARGNNEQHAAWRATSGQRPGDGGFQGGTYCVNFHVGGCEPSPASTIFPCVARSCRACRIPRVEM